MFIPRADLAGRPQHLLFLPSEHPSTPLQPATVDHHLYLTSAGPPSVQVPHPPRWKRPRIPPPYRPCHQHRSRSPTSANARTSPFFPANVQSSASTRRSGGPPPLNANAPPPEHRTIPLPVRPQHRHHALPHSPSVWTLLSVQVLSPPAPRQKCAAAKRPCHSSPTCPTKKTPMLRRSSRRRRTS